MVAAAASASHFAPVDEKSEARENTGGETIDLFSPLLDDCCSKATPSIHLEQRRRYSPRGTKLKLDSFFAASPFRFPESRDGCQL